MYFPLGKEHFPVFWPWTYPQAFHILSMLKWVMLPHVILTCWWKHLCLCFVLSQSKHKEFYAQTAAGGRWQHKSTEVLRGPALWLATWFRDGELTCRKWERGRSGRTREHRTVAGSHRLAARRYQGGGMDLNANAPACQSLRQSSASAITTISHTLQAA